MAKNRRFRLQFENLSFAKSQPGLIHPRIQNRGVAQPIGLKATVRGPDAQRSQFHSGSRRASIPSRRGNRLRSFQDQLSTSRMLE